MRAGRAAAVVVVFLSVACTTLGCCRRPAPAGDEGVESVPVVIDDAYIATHSARDVLEPVWWKGNIYGTPTDYENSLRPFTVHQRRLFAIEWYEAEVDNGGHDQFYFNSTGIVWRDARAGLSDLGLVEGVAVLDETVKRIGAQPSLDRGERSEQLERTRPKFDDLDTRFFAFASSAHLDEVMTTFIRAHPEEFRFQGVIERPRPSLR